MNMTYRCKSCGSNSTANLTCDYCGAGTKQRQIRKTSRDNQTGIVNDLKIVVSAFLASTAFFAVCLITVGGAL